MRQDRISLVERRRLRPMAQGLIAFCWLTPVMAGPALSATCFERLESREKPTWSTIREAFERRGVNVAFPTRQDCDDPARCKIEVGTQETGPLFSVDLLQDKDRVECKLAKGRDRAWRGLSSFCRGKYNNYVFISFRFRDEWNLFVGTQENSSMNQNITRCTELSDIDVPSVISQKNILLNQKTVLFYYSFQDKNLSNRPTPLKLR
jgi:hypothetical protein